MPNLPDTIAIALLAAGAGERFGGGKLDVELRGKPLGRWATDTAEQAGFVRRVLIVSRDRPTFAENLEGWIVAENADARAGIGTSISTAVISAAHCSRLVLALADMPLMAPEHLARIATMDEAVFTLQEDGRPGTPAAFPASAFAELKSLPPGRGATALAGHLRSTIIPPPDPRTLLDVDTPAALREVDWLLESGIEEASG